MGIPLIFHSFPPHSPLTIVPRPHDEGQLQLRTGLVHGVDVGQHGGGVEVSLQQPEDDWDRHVLKHVQTCEENQTSHPGINHRFHTLKSFDLRPYD